MTKYVSKYSEFKEFINEAFSQADFQRALEIIFNYLNKKVGPLYQLPGSEVIEKADGSLLNGVRYIDDKGGAIRFNWDSKFSSADLHSVDVFGPNFSQPEVTMEFNGDSAAQYMPAIVELYKTKRPIKVEDYFEGEDVDESFAAELREMDEIFEVRKAAVKPATRGAKNVLKKDSKAAGKAVATTRKPRATVKKGVKEKAVTKGEVEAEKLLEVTDYADPHTIFDDMDAFVQMVVDKVQPSLIITGGAGVGKSYCVEQVMKRNAKRQIQPMEIPDDMSIEELRENGWDPEEETAGDWVQIKGASTAFGMYVNLYKYRDKIVVFDDCDKVFTDKDGVNILKGALDSGDKRVISWVSKSTTGKKAIAPPRFEFKGQVIFISNMHLKQIDSAVKNRSFVIDLTLRASDVLIRIKSIMPKIMAGVLTDDAKNKAFEFLTEAAEEKGADFEISIRSLINYARIAQSGAKQWKRLMMIQAKNTAS